AGHKSRLVHNLKEPLAEVLRRHAERRPAVVGRRGEVRLDGEEYVAVPDTTTAHSVKDRRRQQEDRIAESQLFPIVVGKEIPQTRVILNVLHNEVESNVEVLGFAARGGRIEGNLDLDVDSGRG